jgi:transcriptional regulator with XRE-family HTH domain
VANENLRGALERAGLTDEQFADIVQVDPRTVQRWLSGRAPYRRHRARIARALDLTELELWPNVNANVDTDPEVAADRPTHSAENVSLWTYLDDPNAPDPAALVADGEGPIDVLDSAAQGRVEDQFAASLLRYASAQRPVRILRREPTRSLLPLMGQPHIEIKIIDGWTSCWMLRTGETLFLTVNPGLDLDTPSLIVVEQRTANELFTRLTNDFEELWENHDNTLEDPDQLDDWLAEEPDEAELRSGPPPAAVSSADAPVSDLPPDRGSDPLAQRQRRRRWPNRAD